jgi:SAM-dependent methyltransferase
VAELGAPDSYPAIFSRHARAYAKRQDEIMAAHESPSRQAALEWLKARRGMRILDVGCGPGTLTLPLARALEGEGEVIGIDAAEGMLEIARQRAGNLPVRFLRMSAETLQFPPAGFDAAISGHTLQFVAQPERALREVHRVLKPKGRFGASLPHRTEPHPVLEAMQTVLNAHLGEPEPEPPRPQLVRDPARLQRALIGAGYRFAEVVEVTREVPVGSAQSFVAGELAWWVTARRLEKADDRLRQAIEARSIEAVGELLAANPSPIVSSELVVRAEA